MNYQNQPAQYANAIPATDPYAAQKTYAAQGQAAAYNDPRDQTQLDAIRIRIDQVVACARDFNGRLAAFLSRAVAEGGLKGQDSAPRPVPNGTIGAITESLDHLDGALAEIASHLNRLERIA